MRIGQEFTGIFPVEGDPDGASVEVRLLTPGEDDDIREEMEAIKTVFKKKEDSDGYIPELSANARLGDKRYLQVVRATVSWNGFFDRDGNPLECSEANKLAAARFDARYPETVFKALKALKERREGKKAEELGNLEASHAA